MYTFEVWLGDGWKVFENKSYIPSVGTIIESSLHRPQEVTRVILDIDRDFYTIETKDV